MTFTLLDLFTSVYMFTMGYYYSSETLIYRAVLLKSCNGYLFYSYFAFNL